VHNVILSFGIGVVYGFAGGIIVAMVLYVSLLEKISHQSVQKSKGIELDSLRRQFSPI